MAEHESEDGKESTAVPTVRWRSWGAVVLVVLGSLVGLVAVVCVEAQRLVFTTDRFMGAVGPTLDDPALYEVLGEFAGDEVVRGLDLEGRLTSQLQELDDLLAEVVVDALQPRERVLALLQNVDRPTLAALAPGVASFTEERIHTRIASAFTSDLVRDAVPALVEKGHGGLVALLEGDMEALPNLAIADGEVRLNLLPLMAGPLSELSSDLRGVLGQVSLPSRVSERADEAIAEFRKSLGERVPDDFGQLPLMTEEQLDNVQTAYDQVNRFTWLWIAVALALVAAAIAVSPRRRRTLVHVALALVVVFGAGIVLMSRLDTTLGNAVGTGDGAALVRGLVGDTLAGIRSTMWVVVGVVVAAAAVVAYLQTRPVEATEPPDVATADRIELTPSENSR